MKTPQVLCSHDVLNQIEGNVLLINPPVVDTRYPWVKWNQPLDLLKLGTLLSEERDCQVKLFDFMLPSPTGRVSRRHFRFQSQALSDDVTYWHYGKSWEDFDGYLANLSRENWFPSYVWITTLTSFWWQAVPLVANQVKNQLGRPLVVVSGNYSVLETEHAAVSCPNVDIVVSDHLDSGSWPADFSLYGEHRLRFCALDLRSPDPLAEIDRALERDVSHFVFFNDNLFQDFDSRLEPVLHEVASQDWRIWLHGICGVRTEDFPCDHAKLLADANFAELHFEPVLSKDGMLNLPIYEEVMRACGDAGLLKKRGLGWESRTCSGFLWIGRPSDDLDKLTWNALKLVQLVGMVIPKPYSPTPGSEDYELLKSRVQRLEPEDISPHRLPFAGLNGIRRQSYNEFYRMTALLNSKVRGHTFDFLGDTYLARVIRESLRGRRWQYE